MQTSKIFRAFAFAFAFISSTAALQASEADLKIPLLDTF